MSDEIWLSQHIEYVCVCVCVCVYAACIKSTYNDGRVEQHFNITAWIPATCNTVCVTLKIIMARPEKPQLLALYGSRYRH